MPGQPLSSRGAANIPRAAADSAVSKQANMRTVYLTEMGEGAREGRAIRAESLKEPSG